ncbi:hypothetical protein VPBG_00090 [Vibrio phage helene 12B3]|uniref:hypothetical protein n=1 Tax=Vibrio phage helene 12B3 TaxID=573173 RepID=UPI0002C0C16D|nr:hypothetical protein VPBG_00090 [Vibrio phage helene 12B3]AGG57862.1 hypothetical protein VPBG_00090 [Vibrio phage helene 12B3]
MELIINLKNDTIIYSGSQGQGVMANDELFGFDKFYISKFIDGTFEIEFVNPEGKVYNFPCKFTDHNTRLVVTI